jgi:hypothetical protein
MQWSVRNLTCAITLAVLGTCALGANPAQGQSAATTTRSVLSRGPVNPLRSEILPVQATEPLPGPIPLQRTPQFPQPNDSGQAPRSIPQPPAPGLGQTPPQPLPPDSSAADSWPGEAPVQEHYGPGHVGNGLIGPPGIHHEAYGAGREPWFAHDDPNDNARYTGWGEPLTGTSWRNRPWYVGFFVGGILNDDLVSGAVDQSNAPLLGIRLGNDFDHFWGWEGRYAFNRTELFDGDRDPIVEDGRNYYVDVALLHYPWGDSRWRPYIMAGVGFSNHRFENDLGFAIDDSSLTIPWGVGLKHYYSPWFTMRFDIVDNWSLGSGQIDSMHNFSFMAGVEFRFGGYRPSYFPWNGNTVYW